MRELIVTISPDGTTQVEVKGVSGPHCLDLTKDLAAGDVVETKKTKEFYQLGQTQVQQTQKLGG